MSPDSPALPRFMHARALRNLQTYTCTDAALRKAQPQPLDLPVDLQWKWKPTYPTASRRCFYLNHARLHDTYTHKYCYTLAACGIVTHTRARTHTRTHVRTHTRTHAQTHTQMLSEFDDMKDTLIGRQRLEAMTLHAMHSRRSADGSVWTPRHNTAKDHLSSLRQHWGFSTTNELVTHHLLCRCQAHP